MRIISLIIIYMLFVVSYNITQAQSFDERYYSFKQQIHQDYNSFRDECNQKYAEFLRNSWSWYEGKSPIPIPKDELFIPPKPYIDKEDESSLNTQPIVIEPIENSPQPKPVEPIKEIINPDDNYFAFDFYGINCNVRLPKCADLGLNDCQPNSIAAGWEQLCNDGMNNAIRDCLETRIRYNLCDWAYLMFLEKLGKEFCENSNDAILLTAFLYCQSGYQMRLGVDGNKLLLLYGSKHQIFDKVYFDIDGTLFYPLGEPSNSISICGAAFEGETPLSLIIDKEQMLGADMSDKRIITSELNKDMSVVCQVQQKLIGFYNAYPTSSFGGNPMTRWAMYANTPLADKTKEILYPHLRRSIAGKSKLQASEMILNWVQTGFVYEYDDKVWGHDRAFFSEETLYYPYCDCEDRSILFSRIVRDLLGLDVALIYYPGHLATAVKFDSEVNGDSMFINGERFVICDPTYIGAPVGKQMPDLEYDKTQAIVLNK